MNKSFELEGIELRIQQKPLAEFVEQSASISIDYSINPKIFFAEDGKIYFFDESVEEPVALENVEGFYERIRLEDGQLKFYNSEFTEFISLSFFVESESEFVDKVNALVEGESKRIARSLDYDSKEQYISALNFEVGDIVSEENQVVNTSAGPDYLEIAEDFKDALFNSTMVINGQNVFDFIVDNFTYGMGKFNGFEFGQNSNIFNLDTGEFINKLTAINDRYFTFGQEPIPEGATDLRGELFAVLVNESAEIIQSFDGMGNLMHKFFAPRTIETLGNGFDIITNTTIPTQIGAINSTFTIGGSGVAGGCDIEDITEPVTIGSFYRGYMAFKYKSGEITANSTTGLYNTPLGSSECDGKNSISVVETSLGDLSFDNTNVYPVLNTDPVTAFFRTGSDTTNLDGSVDFQYVFTPIANTLVGNFYLNPETMVDYTQGEDVIISWTPGLSSAPARKMVGVFEAGTLKINIKSGFVRPDTNFDTVYNVTQTYTTPLSANVNYGFVNSTLGPISFDEETTFELTSAQLVEIWYEDFDNTDNDGSLFISYNYDAANQIEEENNITSQETLVYDGFIKNDNYKHLLPYALDHFARIVSFGLNALWYNAMFEECASRGFINVSKPNEFVESGIDITPEQLVAFTDARFRTQIFNELVEEGALIHPSKYSPLDLDDVLKPIPFRTIISDFIDDFFYRKKVFYEDVELTTLDIQDGPGIVDYRNYFVYEPGSGMTRENFIFKDLTGMNDVWLDVPDTYAVVPKSPNNYALSTLVNFTADFRPGVPCRIDFRLLDSTSQTELDRITYDFNRAPHTDKIGDLIFENRETMHVQLSYFGPIPSISCPADQFRRFCELDGRNINEHFVLPGTFTNDSVNFETFQVIADRVTEFIKNGGGNVGDDKEEVELEAPRVLRVQWRMRFDDDVGVRAQLSHDLPQFKFDAYAPSNENLFTINTYSFGDVYGRGLTAQGVATFNGRTKRVLVEGDDISFMPDNKYSVSLTPNKNVNVWVENKTDVNFDIVSEKEFEGEVSWIAIRQRTDGEATREKSSSKLVPPCVIDREYPYSEYSDLDILKSEGYFTSVTGPEEDQEVQAENEEGVTGDQTKATFIDPNGVRCSQECFDDCPEDYICSPDCYTASLTESGCGCCECLEDNDCPPGYICNEVNECIPI